MHNFLHVTQIIQMKLKLKQITEDNHVLLS